MKKYIIYNLWNRRLDFNDCPIFWWKQIQGEVSLGLELYPFLSKKNKKKKKKKTCGTHTGTRPGRELPGEPSQPGGRSHERSRLLAGPGPEPKSKSGNPMEILEIRKSGNHEIPNPGIRNPKCEIHGNVESLWKTKFLVHELIL